MSDLKLTGDAKALMDIVERLGWELGQADMYKAEALMQGAEDILARVVVVDVDTLAKVREAIRDAINAMKHAQSEYSDICSGVKFTGEVRQLEDSLAMLEGTP